ncbi:hypothetical protein [Dokdonia sp.]|uniref:hypothetical protein n=1 Tax=Dokdonia sp. TaxID=2024995 RepID=UPI0032672C7D
MKFLKLFFKRYAVLLLVIVISCDNDDTQTVISDNEMPIDETMSILFIGNSHTNYNSGIATHLEGFASSLDIEIQAQIIAPNGFTLEEHLQSESTLFIINNTDWDVIILQENTYRAAYETEEMKESILAFKDVLASINMQVYLFKTWAYQDMPEMNNLLDTAYNESSLLSDFPVISIGSAWETFLTASSINIYDDDTIHPNLNGTYLTAGLFFKKLFSDQNIISSPYNSSLTPEIASEIKTFVSSQTIIQ